MQLSELNLNENPFRIGPPILKQEIFWVGFSGLQGKIDQRINFAINFSPSRIVLNWGRYGSGKTHAANYYTRIRSNEIATARKLPLVKSIKLILPRTSKDPVQSLLRNFFGQISLKQIKEDFNQLTTFLDSSEIVEIIESVSNDNVITEVYKKIITGEDADINLLESYLFGDSTKTVLSALGLPSGLKDDEQIVNFLSTYVTCITYNKLLYSSFVMWLDEFEDIDTLNKISQDRFTTFLRQFFDKTPNNFLLFLNFTPKTFYNIEDLSLTLGEALTTRAKLQISFDPPNMEEAKTYILELLNNVIFRNSSQGFHPFSEDAVEYILRNIGVLSVRKINEVFSIVLEMALSADKTLIDAVFIDSIKSEIVSWEGF